MSLRLLWSGVCVHCRAPIKGEAPFPVPIPISFRHTCLSCDQAVTITLLEEGAMVAAPRNRRLYPYKP